ncbi:MAG: hypothetical protein VW312_06845, partial [Opitutales bacterium]
AVALTKTVKLYKYENSSYLNIGFLNGSGSSIAQVCDIDLNDNGTKIVVGFCAGDSNAVTDGFIEIFHLNNSGSWESKGVFSDSGISFTGAGVAIDASGDYVAFSSPGSWKYADINSGSTRISLLSLNGSNYQFIAKYEDTVTVNEFGWSIDLSDDKTIIIGSPVRSNSSGYQLDIGGRAIIVSCPFDNYYTRSIDAPGCNQKGSIQIGEFNSEYPYGSRFGNAVSISSNGDRIAVGEIYFPLGTNTGRTKVFNYNGTDFIEESAINGLSNSNFSGGSVSLSSEGYDIAISDHLDDSNGDNSGTVRVISLR